MRRACPKVVGNKVYDLLKVKTEMTMTEVLETYGRSFSNQKSYFQLSENKENITTSNHLILVSINLKKSGIAKKCLDDTLKVRQILDLNNNENKINETISSEYIVFVQCTNENHILKPGTFMLNQNDRPEESEEEEEELEEVSDSPKEKKRLKNLSNFNRPLKMVHLSDSDDEQDDRNPEEKEEDSDYKMNTSESNANYGDFPFGLSWKQPDTFFWALDSPKILGAEKVVGFDMDHTLVIPKGGRKFAKGRNDWLWWNPKVVPTLKKYHNKGFKVAIFTNQAGIEKKKVRVNDLTGKILDLTKELGFPIQAFICGGNNHWRKPHTTMWDYLSSNMNKNVNIDLKKSLYVGDAAGRMKNWRPGYKKDFSCSDRKFAVNIGVGFMTPEEFFLQASDVANVKILWGSMDPIKFLKENPEGRNAFEESNIVKSEQELILFVGLPASGKSTFAEKYLIPNDYTWINRDTLKTPKKCQKVLRQVLEEGKSAVVDNTLPSVAKRKNYIDIAKLCKVPIRCFYFNVSRELASHLNLYRERLTEGKRRRVPRVGFNMFKSRFEIPSEAEGFTEIVTVKFVPNFKNAKEREWFQKWT